MAEQTLWKPSCRPADHTIPLPGLLPWAAERLQLSELSDLILKPVAMSDQDVQEKARRSGRALRAALPKPAQAVFAMR